MGIQLMKISLSIWTNMVQGWEINMVNLGLVGGSKGKDFENVFFYYKIKSYKK